MNYLALGSKYAYDMNWAKIKEVKSRMHTAPFDSLLSCLYKEITLDRTLVRLSINEVNVLYRDTYYRYYYVINDSETLIYDVNDNIVLRIQKDLVYIVYDVDLGCVAVTLNNKLYRLRGIGIKCTLDEFDSRTKVFDTTGIYLLGDISKIERKTVFYNVKTLELFESTNVRYFDADDFYKFNGDICNIIADRIAYINNVLFYVDDNGLFYEFHIKCENGYLFVHCNNEIVYKTVDNIYSHVSLVPTKECIHFMYGARKQAELSYDDIDGKPGGSKLFRRKVLVS